MANKDAPFGFRPVKRDGSPWTGGTVLAYWAGDTSTTLYPGDPVVLTGTGDDFGVPAVARAAGTGAVFGVMTEVASSFEPGDDSNGLLRDTPRFLSTEAGYLQVVKADRGTVFEIQEDSDSATLAKTDIGRTFDIVFGTPSTSHPIISAAEINSDTGSTADQCVRVLGLARRPDNSIGTNAVWLVEFNQPQTSGV